MPDIPARGVAMRCPLSANGASAEGCLQEVLFAPQAVDAGPTPATSVPVFKKSEITHVSLAAVPPVSAFRSPVG